MGQVRSGRDKVAIVRVEIREPSSESLIVDLLEVGRDRGADRRIGRAADPDAAGHLLADWLRGLLSDARDGDRPDRSPRRRGGDDGVTVTRRSRTGLTATLADDGPEVTQ